MPNDNREARAETIQVLLPWGTPLAERDEAPGGAAFWVGGGAFLLVWTALALLLTSI